MRLAWLLAAFFGAGVAAAPPDAAPSVFPIAIVDGWQAHEADAFVPENGWQATHFRPDELARLTRELPQYTAVILGSLAGYEKNLPWAEFSGIWRKYLEDGGVLVILDANYASATTDIFGSWGDAFQLKSVPGCVVAERKAGHFPVITDDHPEYTRFPNVLAPLFAGYSDGWAHFAELPPGWVALARCPDGAAFLALKPVGLGALVASAYGGFNPETRQIMLEALVENILAARHLQAHDLAGGIWEWDNRFGPSQIRITVTGRNVPVAATVFRNGEQLADGEGDGNGVMLTYRTIAGGPLQTELRIKTDPEVIVRRHANIPEPVTLRLNRYFLDPAAPELVLNPETATDFQSWRLRCLLDGNPVAEGDAAAPLRIVLVDRKSGTGTVELQLLDPETNETAFHTPPEKFTFSDVPAEVSVGIDGAIRLRNEPFFPLGFYHVSADPKLTLASRLEALHFAAEHGYNTLHVAVSPHETVATFGTFLDQVQALGVHVIVEAYYDSAVIERYRNHPAILAWNIGDEPDLAGTPYRSYQQKYRDTVALDSQHPAYSVVMTPEAVRRYWPVPPLIGVDPYPVPHQPIDTVYHYIHAIDEVVAGHGIAPVAVLQAFGYAGEKTYGRVPTPEEARNMFFQALVAGARGVIFYTWQDGRFALHDHPELQHWLAELPAAIQPYEAFWLRGRRTLLADPAPGVYGAEWFLEGKTLTILVNTTDRTVVIDATTSLAPLEVKISTR